ncbi:MAG: hypothetical protein PHY16_14575 [Methylobacter sp.]|nr:hypothetical protein [Methylobacter sp.]
MKSPQDRNFDNLIDKFEQRVYDTFKGGWRLKLLKEDLDIFYKASEPLTVWDAGCGFAQISRWLAEQGHHLTLCDLSEKQPWNVYAAQFCTSCKPVRFRGYAAKCHCASSPERSHRRFPMRVSPTAAGAMRRHCG